jgi:hypothetical protein
MRQPVSQSEDACWEWGAFLTKKAICLTSIRVFLRTITHIWGTRLLFVQLFSEVLIFLNKLLHWCYKSLYNGTSTHMKIPCQCFDWPWQTSHWHETVGICTTGSTFTSVSCYVLITYKHSHYFYKIPFCSTKVVSVFLLITNKHSVIPYKVYTVLLSNKKLLDNTELWKKMLCITLQDCYHSQIILNQFRFIHMKYHSLNNKIT